MRQVHRYRYLLLASLLAAAILLFPKFKSALRIDNSLTTWFIEGDPALESYYQFQEYFGNDEVVILLVKPRDSLFTEANLRKLKNLVQGLEKLPDVARVNGPGSARLPQNNVFGSASKALIGDSLSPLKVLRIVQSSPFLKQQFFTADLQGARHIIRLTNSPDFERRRPEILEDIYRETKNHFGEEETYFGGIGIIYEALNQLSRHDFSRFLGLGYLLMFIAIYLIYRRWAYVAYALLTALFSTYFTLAFYGWAGLQLNLMTTLVPAIIILLCVMDVMHILNERNKSGNGEDNRKAALNSLKRVWRPCLFTTLTTMAGFLTLVTSPIKILVTFGLFSAVGILLGLLFSYLFGVLILPAVRHETATQRTGRLLVQMQNSVIKNAKLWAFVVTGLVILALWGARQIVIDTDSLAYLPEDHKVRQDSRVLERELGPYMPLEFLVFPREGYDMQSPALIKGLIQFERQADQLRQMGSTIGYHSLYKAAFKDRYGEDWRNQLDKSEAFYENIARRAERAFPELTRSLVTANYEVGRMYVSGNLISAATLGAKIDSLQAIEGRTIGQIARLEVTGYQGLYAEIVNYVTRSQVNSFGLAVVLIFILLLLFLRDLKLATLSLLPNLFPIAIMLGFMGWFGINLDTATACIASIVLSFSIDDTIHFAFHFNLRRKAGSNGRDARIDTMAHVGRAILLTSVVLFTGYFLMLFGALKTVVYFGLLTAVSIAAALFSQLVIFPLLLARFYR